MKRWKLAFAAPLALLSLVSHAQTTLVSAPAGLPADEVSMRLIQDDPSVARARYSYEAARQRAVGLVAGPHEWTARSQLQRRRDRSLGVDSNEWSVGIERAVRINGKAGIDRALGEAHIELSAAKLGQARHEAAVELMTLWTDWASAWRVLQLWQEQARFSQESLDAVEKRRRAGDASMLELNAAKADLAEVQRQLSMAHNDETRARLKTAARFPGLALGDAQGADPIALGGDSLQWRERILAESEVLRVARGELRLSELEAARSRADRVPDPSVGLFTTSERSGAERIVGLSFSMPIGGASRRAQERENAQVAEAARAALELAQRQLEAQVAQEMANAEGNLDRWKLANQSLTLAQENARLTQRAYAAGEVDLQALLMARRLRGEASLGAEQARGEALRSRYRLLIDAHLIWGLSAD